MSAPEFVAFEEEEKGSSKGENEFEGERVGVVVVEVVEEGTENRCAMIAIPTQ